MRTRPLLSIAIVVFISFLCLIVFPEMVEATTYYIDATDGSNSNSGLTPGAAWKDLSKASASPVTSGDIILLQGGETWTGQTLTPAASTTIDVYDSGAKPIIDGNSAVARSISITANNVTVSNIAVKGATSSMVFVGASGAVLQDIDSTGNPIAFRINSGSATLNRVTATGASNAAFFFENSSSSTLNIASTSSMTTGNGFRVINASTVTCNDCTASGSVVDGFSISNTSVLTCTRCKSFNNGSTGDSTSGDGFTSHDTSTLNVRYSIGYGNYKAGVAATGASSGEVLNSTFYNNVQATNGSGWDSSGDLGIGINATGSWVVKNNITYGHPVEFMVSAVAVSGGASVTSDYNIFYDSLGGSAFDYNGNFYGFSGYQTASGKDSHSMHVNPMLNDVSGSDFRLRGESPAINAGVSVGFSTDYVGAIVPQGSAVDIGAYEYVHAIAARNTSSSSSRSTASVGCGFSKPETVPRLFQINVYQDKATLYFVGVDKNATSYFIAYGYGWQDERFGVEFRHGKPEGALNYTVNALEPNKKYYFKVRAGNECMPGDWSNVLWGQTYSSRSDKIFLFTAWDQMREVVNGWI